MDGTQCARPKRIPANQVECAGTEVEAVADESRHVQPPVVTSGSDTAADTADDGGVPTQPTDSAAPVATDQQAAETEQVELLPPVVPKFYGYYLPVDDDGTMICHTHTGCKEDGKCVVRNWPTRLLLLEQCGVSIEPRVLSYEQR